MTYIGIDLAWNVKRRSGLAALAPDGRLIDSTSLITDSEIDGWLDQFPDTRVAAIDAPLIVPNKTGSRACEKAIGVAFGRFDAGAYPANRGNPLFDPPRGAKLCDRRGWPMHPHHSDRSRAIEVYPHPAMVGLFRLISTT